ncbi:MAG TPA: response regulator transcription factor [Cyclobacteriaceae bacterium]|jgi:DNA-binding NarL/FixJ family response regulator|nr:response regulator transcription factor [Cyclobacteriaceae bacterium]
MIRIILADDHAIVRRGLKQLILEKFSLALIGEADNTEELLKNVIISDWDIVICDLNMPGQSGLDALKQIRQAKPKLPVLIMSMFPEDQYGLRVIKAGASGYLSKDSIHDVLITAIQTVLKGKKFISPAMAETLAKTFYSGKDQVIHQSLSDRELEVFALLASGKTVSEIAHKLSLGVTTVSTYRYRILEKMNMRSNTDLTRYALEKWLI